MTKNNFSTKSCKCAANYFDVSSRKTVIEQLFFSQSINFIALFEPYIMHEITVVFLLHHNAIR